MRVFITISIIAAFLFVTACNALVADDKPILTEEFVARVNRLNGGLWTASYNNGMKHLTRREAMRLMGALKETNSSLPHRKFTAEEIREDLPESFDAAEKWPNCPTITKIADQSNCGSCWAVAAASAISDRYCTIGGVRDVQISAADLMGCCSSCGFGCSGGYPSVAWSYFKTNGIVSQYCQPYPFPSCAHHVNSTEFPSCSTLPDYNTPSCNASCTDKTIPMIKYQGNNSYDLEGEENYKRELFLNGPFEVAFTVYADFVAYKSGVYKYVSGAPLGGHAVRLVGWGTFNGTPYWKIANSWNDEWGMNGYFFIARGVNECNIEKRGYAGTPSVPKVFN